MELEVREALPFRLEAELKTFQPECWNAGKME